MLQPTVFDRSFQYGDGVFTTIKVEGGELQRWSLHWQRLQLSCQRLAIHLPDESTVLAKAKSAITGAEQVVKLVVSRGHGGRGYSCKGVSGADIYVIVSPLPVIPHLHTGIKLGVAQLQLGIQPLLAGIKHNSRLETVLLKAEAERSNYDDLLVTDSAGFVTECCAANIFFAHEGLWHTPKLTRAGVAGVMREWLFSQIEVIEDDFSLATVRQAEAMFISNALIGIVPVRSFELKKLDISPVLQLQTALKLKGCK